MASACLLPEVAQARPDDDESLLLQCCVCGQRLREPLLLDCLHDCCRQCASSIGGGGGSSSQLSAKEGAGAAGRVPHGVCPACEEAVDVAGSRLDLFIASRLRALELRSSSAVASCASCAEDGKAGQAARHWCEGCDKSLCDECLAWHNKFYKRHRVAALESGEPTAQQQQLQWRRPLSSTAALSAAWQPAVCEQHRVQLDFFCFSCQLLKCSECGKVCIEARHDITSLEGPRIDSYVAQVRESIRAAQASVADKLAVVRSRAAAASGSSHGGGEALASRLEAARQRDVERLRQNRNAVAEAVRRAYERAEQGLHACYDGVSAAAEEQQRRDEALGGVLRYCLMYSRVLLDEAGNGGLLYQRQPLLSRLQSLADRAIDGPVVGDAAGTARCVTVVSEQPADMESVILQWIGLCTVSDDDASGATVTDCDGSTPSRKKLSSAAAAAAPAAAAAAAVPTIAGPRSASPTPANDGSIALTPAKDAAALPSHAVLGRTAASAKLLPRPASEHTAPGLASDTAMDTRALGSRSDLLLSSPNESVPPIASAAPRLAPLLSESDVGEGDTDFAEVHSEAGPLFPEQPVVPMPLAQHDSGSAADPAASGSASGRAASASSAGLTASSMAEATPALAASSTAHAVVSSTAPVAREPAVGQPVAEQPDSWPSAAAVAEAASNEARPCYESEAQACSASERLWPGASGGAEPAAAAAASMLDARQSNDEQPSWGASTAMHHSHKRWTTSANAGSNRSSPELLSPSAAHLGSGEAHGNDAEWNDGTSPLVGHDAGPSTEDPVTTNAQVHDDGEPQLAWPRQLERGAAAQPSGKLSGLEDREPLPAAVAAASGGSGAGVEEERDSWPATASCHLPAGSSTAAASWHELPSGESRPQAPSAASSSGSMMADPHIGQAVSTSTVTVAPEQPAAPVSSSKWWERTSHSSTPVASTSSGNAEQAEAPGGRSRGRSPPPLTSLAEPAPDRDGASAGSAVEPRAAEADACVGGSHGAHGSELLNSASADELGDPASNSEGPPPLEGSSDDSGSDSSEHNDIAGGDYNPAEEADEADAAGEAITYENFIDEDSQQYSAAGYASVSHDRPETGGGGGGDVRGREQPVNGSGAAKTNNASNSTATGPDPRPLPTNSYYDDEDDEAAASGAELVNDIAGVSSSSSSRGSGGVASTAVSRGDAGGGGEQSLLRFDFSSLSFKLRYDCVDVAFTAEGSLLLAAGVDGLLELDVKDGAVLSYWLPPLELTPYRDSWVGSVQPLEDGRVAVGLPTSPFLVVLRRHDRQAKAWVQDQSIALRSHCVWRLAVHGSVIAAAACTATTSVLAGGSPGSQLLMVSAVGGIELSLKLLYPIWSVALTERVVVTLSEGRQPMSGGNTMHLVDAYRRDDGELSWRHGSAERIAGVCATASGRLLYVSLPDSHRVMGMGADDGRPLCDVLSSASHWLDTPPAWLSLHEKPATAGRGKGSKGGCSSSSGSGGSMAVLASDRRILRLYPVSS